GHSTLGMKWSDSSIELIKKGLAEYYKNNSNTYQDTVAKYSVGSNSATVVVPNLNQSTTYHYKVTIEDIYGNEVSTTDRTLVTSGLTITHAEQTTPPTNSTDAITTISTATIKFAVNSSKYFGARVYYGVGYSSYSGAVYSSGEGKYVATIDNLASNTSYPYKIAVIDSEGQEISQEYTPGFKTKTFEVQTLKLGGVAYQSGMTISTADSAILTFITNNSSAIADLKYSSAQGGDHLRGEPDGGGNYSLVANELKPATTYSFDLFAEDNTGAKTTTVNGSFKTADFDILSSSIDQIAEDSAVITWSTNALATADIVVSGEGGAYSKTINVSTPTKNGSEIIHNLKPGQSYSATIDAYDSLHATAADIDKPKHTDSSVVVFGSSSFYATDLGSVVTSNSSAEIRWNTASKLSDSFVKYWEGADEANASVLGSLTLDVAHLVTLRGLKSGTTYNYKVYSKDANGNLTEDVEIGTNKNQGTFETDNFTISISGAGYSATTNSVTVTSSTTPDVETNRFVEIDNKKRGIDSLTTGSKEI
ncbi:hypothetical protein LCGC14_2402800, partial [marine sediment metagenome]